MFLSSSAEQECGQGVWPVVGSEAEVSQSSSLDNRAAGVVFDTVLCGIRAVEDARCFALQTTCSRPSVPDGAEHCCCNSRCHQLAELLQPGQDTVRSGTGYQRDMPALELVPHPVMCVIVLGLAQLLGESLLEFNTDPRVGGRSPLVTRCIPGNPLNNVVGGMAKRRNVTNSCIQHKQGVVEKPVSPVVEPVVGATGDRGVLDGPPEDRGPVTDIKAPVCRILVQHHTNL